MFIVSYYSSECDYLPKRQPAKGPSSDSLLNNLSDVMQCSLMSWFPALGFQLALRVYDYRWLFESIHRVPVRVLLRSKMCTSAIQ